MNTYQFVVISLNQDRKQKIKNQFDKIGVTDVYYMNAATIDNSIDYLPSFGYSEQEKKVICCCRSHLYCLEFACLKSSPEYTIILEDDVAFHKTQLINGIEEIIQRWDSELIQCGLVSLGWVPIESHDFYAKYKPLIHLRYGEGSKVLQLINSGLQMYIVKKSRIQHIIPYLIHPTFLQMKQVIENYKSQTKNSILNPMVADLFINVIIPPAIVFPPLAIEQQTESTLEHNNWELYWKPYFSHIIKRLDDYYI